MIAGILIGLAVAAVVLLIGAPPVWLPLAISPEAVQVDAQFLRNLKLLGTLFVLAQLALVFAILRYRERGQQVRPWVGKPALEIAWAALITVLFAWLGITGATLWTPNRLNAAQKPEVIEVYAHQFAWDFRYPGPDGRFGRTDVHLINDAMLNPFGLDDRDPAAQDDILGKTLRVPVNRPVELVLHARDVTHDFFVRELRLKQDIVPGMETLYQFTATRPGSYEIACAQLCGLGHSQMRALLIVMPEADYQSWKQARHR